MDKNQSKKIYHNRPKRHAALIIIYGIPSLIIAAVMLLLVFQINLYFSNKNKNETIIADIRYNEDALKPENENIRYKLNKEFVVKTINELLTPNDRVYLIGEFWEYSLTVNGTEVKQKTVEVAPGDVTVVLTQKMKITMFPPEIINQGNVMAGDTGDSLDTHIFVFNDEGVKMDMDEKDGVTTITNSFSIKAGKEASVQISSNLQKKLDIEGLDIIKDRDIIIKSK